MGAGLADQLRKKYSNLLPEYRETVRIVTEETGDRRNLLGTVKLVNTEDNKIIANVFGQEGVKGYGRKGAQTEVEYLQRGIREVEYYARMSELSVAIPTHIGCVLGGGDWTEVKQIIEDIFEDSPVDVTFYNYQP